MKSSKKRILIILGVAALAVAATVLCLRSPAGVTVNHALRISELLQPVLAGENQTMHIAVSAEFGGKSLSLERDIYRVTEDECSWFSIEQNGSAVYIADNMLFLENGKAFKIGDQLQSQTSSYQGLLAHIGTLYETLQITLEEGETETAYCVTVTGDQVSTLLALISPGETLPVDGIETLKLCLTAKDGKLEKIVFTGSGTFDGTSVSLNATISGFRVLAAGEYPIPEVVKQSAATVNPDDLFSLTEDLYRLVLALAPFADMKSIDGTLELTVDCGLIQVDTDIRLSDLKNTSNRQLDPEKLQALPEMLGWLCMEGEISCTRSNGNYVYALRLDQTSMKELSIMILPELAEYAGNLTGGSVVIHLESGNITSMELSIEGKISALIVQIPIKAGVIFTFSDNASVTQP